MEEGKIKIMKGEADKKTMIKLLKEALKVAKKFEKDDEITCLIIQYSTENEGYQADFHINRSDAYEVVGE